MSSTSFLATIHQRDWALGASALLLILAAIVWIWIGLEFWAKRPSYQQIREFFTKWEWHPLPTRRKGWPHTADATARMYHARCAVDFSQLEIGHLVKYTLVFFNSGYEEVRLESVHGSISYSGIVTPEQLPVTWSQGTGLVAPLQELFVEIGHRMPVNIATKLAETLSDKKQISVEFALQMSGRTQKSDKFVRFNTWQGIICAKGEVLVRGRLIHTTITILPSTIALTERC